MMARISQNIDDPLDFYKYKLKQALVMRDTKRKQIEMELLDRWVAVYKLEKYLVPGEVLEETAPTSTTPGAAPEEPPKNFQDSLKELDKRMK